MRSEPSRRGRGRPPHPDILTPREWQVLDLLRRGLTNEQIAQRLDISYATAKYHVAEIISKLGVQTREEAAAWQPETVPVRWWQRVIAWVPRRAWPLAGAVGGLAALAALGWIAFGASAGEEGDAVQNAASPSPGVASPPADTPTPQDVTFAPLSISNPQDTKLLFIRGAPDYLAPGSLWMSNLDGTGEKVLIPENAVDQVVSVVRHWQTGRPTVYYISGEERPPVGNTIPQGHVTVFAFDISTNSATQLIGFDTSGGQGEDPAAITADGRFLAYTDVAGLAILDTANGETRRLLEGDSPQDCATSVRRCKHYREPRWSPDGRKLFVFEGGYEGGYSLIINPFDQDPAPVRFEALAWHARWSASGQSFCLVDTGDYDNEVGLIIASAPDWQAKKFLSDYKPSVPDGTIFTFSHLTQCVWVDETRVAILFDATLQPDTPAQKRRAVLVLETANGDVTSLPEHREFSSGRDLVSVPSREFIVSTPHTSRNYPDPVGDALSPDVVDVQTGARRPVLTADDWVAAAVPAELLAP